MYPSAMSTRIEDRRGCDLYLSRNVSDNVALWNTGGDYVTFRETGDNVSVLGFWE